MSDNVLEFMPREHGILAFVKAKQHFQEAQTDEITIKLIYSQITMHNYGARTTASWRLTGFSAGKPHFIGLDEIGDIEYERGESQQSPAYSLTPHIEGHKHLDTSIEHRIAAQVLGISGQLMDVVPSIKKAVYETLGRKFTQKQLEFIAKDYARSAIFLPSNHNIFLNVR